MIKVNAKDKRFEEGYEEFLSHCKIKNLRPATIEHYRNIIGYLWYKFHRSDRPKRYNLEYNRRVYNVLQARKKTERCKYKYEFKKYENSALLFYEDEVYVKKKYIAKSMNRWFKANLNYLLIYT